LLLAGDNKPETVKFRAFLSRYAHYVLIRTQCFGGMFDEIAGPQPTPASKEEKNKKKMMNNKNKSTMKPITSTNLRQENLDAAKLLLNAGVACILKDGEECENTAIAVERVASDLISLTGAVAKALNKALKFDDNNNLMEEGADPMLVKKWVEFYSEELAPKTRAMVKKTAPKLDAFSLFLPSRPSDTVSQDLIQKGLKLGETESGKTVDGTKDDDNDDEVVVVVVEEEMSIKEKGSTETDGEKESWKEEIKQVEVVEGDEDVVLDEEEAELDEYEYEEDEEYYDDEEDEL
jgi:hypothetical protein